MELLVRIPIRFTSKIVTGQSSVTQVLLFICDKKYYCRKMTAIKETNILTYEKVFWVTGAVTAWNKVDVQANTLGGSEYRRERAKGPFSNDIWN